MALMFTDGFESYYSSDTLWELTEGQKEMAKQLTKFEEKRRERLESQKELRETKRISFDTYTFKVEPKESFWDFNTEQWEVAKKKIAQQEEEDQKKREAADMAAQRMLAEQWGEIRLQQKESERKRFETFRNQYGRGLDWDEPAREISTQMYNALTERIAERVMNEVQSQFQFLLGQLSGRVAQLEKENITLRDALRLAGIVIMEGIVIAPMIALPNEVIKPQRRKFREEG